ncbi:LOG family protein [Pannus brasiliensis CCIBt3594]|uniref:LOG family protein n=1 Tax=Pannus brasiliensis CCIBt3594 TaxID=1427578 RepID=A0AAW9R138_9CHRO
MVISHPDPALSPDLGEDLLKLVDRLPDLKHGKWIRRALEVLVRMSGEEIDRLDWKILTHALEDMERGFQSFYPYRHTRKITIFGSARISEGSSEYRFAVEFARRIADLGFMVLTGAGGGIMQAGNEGAGRENSFGLNIQLPFEQGANPYIIDDPKLISFKYFFTRKLFFLRESDAIALFPGGFGTQDEAFETLTLCQTGKYGPAPLVLIDEPGGDYWQTWQERICANLQKRGLISPEDVYLYTITNDLTLACDAIRNFYRVYHSSRFVGESFVMRLNHDITDTQLEQINDMFSDIVVTGKIERSKPLSEETNGQEELREIARTGHLPRLVFHFNQQSYGRLYQLIHLINSFGLVSTEEEHPERK